MKLNGLLIAILMLVTQGLVKLPQSNGFKVEEVQLSLLIKMRITLNVHSNSSIKTVSLNLKFSCLAHQLKNPKITEKEEEVLGLITLLLKAI